MNYFDIAVLIIGIWAAWRGFSKGFIFEVCTLLALVLGIWGAIHFSDPFGQFIVHLFNTDKKLSPVVAFALTFVAIVLLVHLLGKFIETIINLTALSFVNKLFGALLSIAKVTLIISTLILIANAFSGNTQAIPSSITKDSKLYPVIEPIAPIFLPALEKTTWWKKVKMQIEKAGDSVIPS